MKAVGAYVLTDVGTGKFYVGSSGDMAARFDRHFRDLRTNRHHCLALQSLWNKYGKLVQTVFPTDTREEAYEVEQDMLDRYRDSDELLNIGLAVKGGDNLTRHPKREEILAKIKEKLIHRMSGLTQLEKKLLFGLPGSRNGMWGRTHTPEARKRIGAVHVGNSYALGLKRSAMFRAELSQRAKLRTGESNPFHGKRHSEVTRQRLSEKAKLREKLPGNTRPVIINDIEYESLTQAARQLQVTPALIVYRMKNDDPKYAGYRYKDESSTTSP